MCTLSHDGLQFEANTLKVLGATKNDFQAHLMLGFQFHQQKNECFLSAEQITV